MTAHLQTRLREMAQNRRSNGIELEADLLEEAAEASDAHVAAADRWVAEVCAGALAVGCSRSPWSPPEWNIYWRVPGGSDDES